MHFQDNTGTRDFSEIVAAAVRRASANPNRGARHNQRGQTAEDYYDEGLVHTHGWATSGANHNGA